MKVSAHILYIDLTPCQMKCSCEFSQVMSSGKEKQYQHTDKEGSVSFMNPFDDTDCIIELTLYDPITNERIMSVPFCTSNRNLPIDGIFSPHQINIHIERNGDDVTVNCFLLERNGISLISPCPRESVCYG